MGPVGANLRREPGRIPGTFLSSAAELRLPQALGPRANVLPFRNDAARNVTAAMLRTGPEPAL